MARKSQWFVEWVFFMDNGWIKLHRQILLNPIVQKPYYLSLWVLLLLKANHKETKMIWNNDILIVHEGQFITGRKKLAKESGISESTVEDILNFLEKQHQIQQQKNNKYRLITILNWKTYQSPTAKATSRETTRETTSRHKQEVKEKKEDKEGESGASPLIPEVIKLFEGVNPACKRMYGNPPQRRACQDLLDTYGFEELKKVINILPQTNKITYMPTITTPVQLWNEYQKLKDKLVQEKNKITSKNKPNYVL